MLRKLIKYDLLYSFKLFTFLHLLMILCCIVGRLLFLDRITFLEDMDLLIAQISIFMSLYILLLSALQLGVMLIIGARFYKNLFSDEGYLTWTLPATPTQQLWGKILSSTILNATSIVVYALCVLFLVSGRNVQSAYQSIESNVTALLGMPIGEYALFTLLYTIGTSIITVIIIQFCVAIGQLFSGHRVLCSIVVYVVYTTIIQIALFALMYFKNMFSFTTELSSPVFLMDTFKLSLFLFVFVGIFSYAVLHYIMNKKINLL